MEVQASGIFGQIEVNDNEVTDSETSNLLGDNGGPVPFSLFIELSASGANQGTNPESLFNSNSSIYTDPDRDTIYLLTDTDNVMTEDRDYTATFRIGDDEDQATGGTDGPYESPYLDSDEEVALESEFTLAAGADFDYVVVEELQVEGIAEATVSGTTIIAPNEDLTIRFCCSDDPAFLLTNEDVIIQSDGTWGTTFDMSKRRSEHHVHRPSPARHGCHPGGGQHRDQREDHYGLGGPLIPSFFSP